MGVTKNDFSSKIREIWDKLERGSLNEGGTMCAAN